MQVRSPAHVHTEAFSNRAIARALGVSEATIRRDLDVSGDSRESPDRVVGLDGKSYPASEAGQRRMAAAILALRARGMKQVEIAAELGVSQSTVSRALRDWTTA